LRGHNGYISGLVFAADGKRLASVSGGDDTVRLWDLDAGQEALRLPGVGRPNMRVAFSADGSQLYVIGGQKVRLFDAQRALLTPAERRKICSERQSSWNEVQARAAEREHAWFAVAWHSDRLLAQQPDQLDWLKRRANARAELGQWVDCADDLARASELAGKPDFWLLCQRALASVKTNDTDEYYSLCQRLLANYGATRNPSTANSVAWIATLLPPPESDRSWLVDLAEFAEVYAPTQNSRYAAANTLGMVLYRAGRFEEAISTLNQALEYHGDGGNLSDWLLLALNHQRLGNVHDARRWYDKSRMAVQATPNLIADAPIRWSFPWYDRLLNAVLLDEAKQCFESQNNSGNMDGRNVGVP
jgi:hypothetical protein